jgi:hypothetical protein
VTENEFLRKLEQLTSRLEEQDLSLTILKVGLEEQDLSLAILKVGLEE